MLGQFLECEIERPSSSRPSPENRLGSAVGGAGLEQGCVQRHALIEHEARAAEMRAAALLEVVEYGAIELVDLAKALADQAGRGLFAAYAAGAERDDGRILQRFGQRPRCARKVAEGLEPERERVFERAHIHLELVARIEQHDVPALIQPAL